MILLASDPEGLALPLLILIIAGCCVCIFLGAGLMLSGKDKNSAPVGFGILLVILGLLPPFFLAFVWLSVHFARGSDPFFVGVPEEILRAGDRENTLALSSPKAKGVWAQVIATSVSVAQ